MKYYTAIRINGLVTHNNTDTFLRQNAEQKSQAQKNSHSMIPFIQSSKIGKAKLY